MITAPEEHVTILGTHFVINIQGFYPTFEPKKCFGHYSSASRLCLACAHDSACRAELGQAVGLVCMKVSVRPRALALTDGGR